jgi:hypothetical protein
MERWMISCLTLPAVESKQLRVHSEGSLRRGADAQMRTRRAQAMRAAPLAATRDIGEPGGGVARMKTRMQRCPWSDWRARRRLAHALSVATSRLICAWRLRTGLNRAYQYIPASLATPDGVVHHQVQVVPFRREGCVDGLLFFNSVRTSEGAIHPLAEVRGPSGPICVKVGVDYASVRSTGNGSDMHIVDL